MSQYYCYYRCKKKHDTFVKDNVYKMYIETDFEVYYIAVDDDGKEHSVDPSKFKILSEHEAKRHLTIKGIIDHTE